MNMRGVVHTETESAGVQVGGVVGGWDGSPNVMPQKTQEVPSGPQQQPASSLCHG